MHGSLACLELIKMGMKASKGACCQTALASSKKQQLTATACQTLLSLAAFVTSFEIGSSEISLPGPLGSSTSAQAPASLPAACVQDSAEQDWQQRVETLERELTKVKPSAAWQTRMPDLCERGAQAMQTRVGKSCALAAAR